jgi:hypothetical protein
MPHNHVERQENRWRACIHEAGHVGALFMAAIDVYRVSVDGEGNGYVYFNDDCMHLSSLREAVRRDPHQAEEQLLDYLTALRSGPQAVGEPFMGPDDDITASYCSRWALVAGSPTMPTLLAIARNRAIRWLMDTRPNVEAFARQLDCYGVLSGADLQTRLAKTFPRQAPRLAAPVGAPAQTTSAGRPKQLHWKSQLAGLTTRMDWRTDLSLRRVLGTLCA